jgi:hypothetical protein
LVADETRVVLVPEPRIQQTLEPRLLDRLERVLALHIPMVEPHDEHGAIGKVEHGAGSVDADDLAQPHFVVGHVSSSQDRGWP